MADKTICDFCDKNVARRSIKMQEKKLTINRDWNWFSKYYDICEPCYNRMLEFMKKELEDDDSKRFN